eukprot:m.188804 g.188804  ORF g.188804 m.188804 type:complete len:77 (+) comp14789_c2_seq18:2164-2394(+)
MHSFSDSPLWILLSLYVDAGLDTHTRTHSMNDMDNLESLPNSARLQAIIFLEEFCKELSAIVLVEANSVVLSSHLS